jgi:hypothetical protein
MFGNLTLVYDHSSLYDIEVILVVSCRSLARALDITTGFNTTTAQHDNGGVAAATHLGDGGDAQEDELPAHQGRPPSTQRNARLAPSVIVVCRWPDPCGAVAQQCDMSEEMRTEAMDVIGTAVEKFPDNYEVCYDATCTCPHSGGG